ncbi:MAG: sulfatase-like hydrolase/transferase [Verrucomicrobia bacterium]|nr:sulfatase-like hydrolase/transferase [Verrucomicrobiota bacterium]MDA1069286.1 sulfatase-like hydrolase/transferase [Verrucomicrobiota bacterium]
MKYVYLVALGIAFFFSYASPSAQADVSQPNIIYILADDLGIGEVGCYGQQKIKTPHIDQLAAEGMRFTQHYSGAAVCAPSRFTFITGLHIGKSDTYGQGQRLKSGVQILPKLMQAAGYTTGAFGKWGLA